MHGDTPALFFTHRNTVGHTVAAMSQWALVSGQTLSLQLAQCSSDSWRHVDWEPEWTAVSKNTQSCEKNSQPVLFVFGKGGANITYMCLVLTFTPSFQDVSYSAHLRWCIKWFLWWWTVLTGCFEPWLQSSFTASRAGVLREPDDFWHPDKQMFRGHE